jgi:hypothetical protein
MEVETVKVPKEQQFPNPSQGNRRWVFYFPKPIPRRAWRKETNAN